jgi:hypothetical protein
LLGLYCDRSVVTCESKSLRIETVEFEDSPITAFLEAAATSVGVGMVLGGFFAGLAGVLSRAPREVLERQVLNAGYVVAAFCLVLRLAELIRTV